MSRLSSKRNNTFRRQNRVRATIKGNSTRPRLSVHITNKHVSAQVIDDSKQTTLASVSTVGKKDETRPMAKRAEWVGAEIAKKAKAKKIKQVVHDRGPKLYHGRVKALADAARNEGLEF